MLVRTLLATACAIESGHLTLLRGAGRGRLSKELATRRRRGAREEEWTGGATTPHPTSLTARRRRLNANE